MTKYTVVVTGATGRVGSKIVQALLEAGFSVHTLLHSILPAEHPLIREDVAVTVMDLATLPEQDVFYWLKAVQPIALIHSAALADVADCERWPSRAYLMNTDVTRMLAKACARYQVHFIMLSSEHVFSGTAHPNVLYSERDPVHPLNCYGKSKVLGELAVQEECAKQTLWTICRISVVYGLTYDPKFWPRPDFMQWVRTKLHQNEALRVVVDQINSPICVVDLIRILVTIVRQQLQGIYHVAGSTPVSRYHFALQIAQTYGLNTTFVQPILTSEADLSPQRPLNVGLCVDKISHDSGVRPLSLEEGLAFCPTLCP